MKKLAIKRKILEKIKNFDWKKHIVDTTAINTFAVPVSAIMETSKPISNLISKIPYVEVSPVPVDVSIGTRAYAVGLGYLGLGFILSKGRDLSRKLFRIKDSSKEGIKFLHDGAYLIAFNAVLNPILFYLSGCRDIKELIGGTINLSLFSLVAGGPIGYFIDTFRDLTGLEECKRKSYPNFIKQQNSAMKKGLVALLISLSISTTGLNYSLNPNKTSQKEISSSQISQLYNEIHHDNINYFLNYTNKNEQQ